ncbi:MAG: hypothetical protein V3U65_20100 [Granulosicoccaceae bacterium]
MNKSLNQKLERIQSGHYTAADFVIADAKDADMGFGATGPGLVAGSSGRYKTKQQYLAAMKEMAGSGLVDIMLMSASSAETLGNDNSFKQSAVTPAIRLNDTSDIWVARGSRYRDSASLPFRSALLQAVEHIADLGLYSITYSNDLQHDIQSLQAYRAFREELIHSSYNHFLEVFNPAFDIGIAADELGFYINDMIVKTLAGVTQKEAPLFLKIQFNGYAAMHELAQYDPENLIVGILGGAKGTSRDTFELIHQAEQAGARVALFGRKINLAESPLLLVSLMRKVIQQEINPAEAVAEYHGGLAESGITPDRDIIDDSQITDTILQA